MESVLSEDLVRVGDVSMRVERAGEGPTVVALHGMLGLHWTPGLRLLAERCSVVMPEHPGFGLSAQQPTLRKVHDLAVFYLDFLRQEGLLGAPLLGHSFGGWIAAEMAVRAPFSRLALVSPMGTRIRGETREDMFFRPVGEVPDLLYADRSLAPTDGESKEDYRNVNALARYGWSPYLANLALEAELHLITCPTLVLWGRDDRVFPPTHAQIYEREIEGSKSVVLDGAGHDPFSDQPERCAEALIDFLAEEAAPS